MKLALREHMTLPPAYQLPPAPYQPGALTFAALSAASLANPHPQSPASAAAGWLQGPAAGMTGSRNAVVNLTK